MAAIKAEKREKLGKSESRLLRSQGRFPAIIYGNEKESVNISLDTNDFYIEFQKGGFYSKPTSIQVGGEEIMVMPKDVDFHPVNDNPLHADFLRVDEETLVRVAIPVKFKGREKSPGIKRGGVLNQVRRTIELICKAKDIPESLTADVSKLNIRDNVKYSELKIPEGVEPVIKDRDFTVATISGRVSAEKTTDDEAEEVEEQEE